jgi:hypothetical protein
MKPAAPPAVPTLDVSVATLRGSSPAIAAAPDPPSDALEPDGHEAGDRVLVELHGTWLLATLIERRGDRWLVHFDERRGATRESWAELVESERIRVPLERTEEDMGPDDVDP